MFFSGLVFNLRDIVLKYIKYLNVTVDNSKNLIISKSKNQNYHWLQDAEKKR